MYVCLENNCDVAGKVFGPYCNIGQFKEYSLKKEINKKYEREGLRWYCMDLDQDDNDIAVDESALSEGSWLRFVKVSICESINRCCEYLYCVFMKFHF